MSAVMLGNIGQLPGASKPAAGVNYRALAGDVSRLRAELPRRWGKLSEPERVALYNAALESATFRPNAIQIVGTAPKVLRLYRAGQVGDFLDYGRMVTLFWDDVLSLSENDNAAFQKDALDAVHQVCEEKPMAILKTQKDIHDFFQNL